VKLVFGIVRQFVVEEIFGFNEASVADFLKTQAIGIGFSLLVWGVLGAGLLVAIDTMPQLWWIAGTGLFTVVILGMSVLQTRVIIPLMYDTSQIEGGELHDAVTDIFDAAGGRCDAVYSIETSSETSRLNAVVSGIGASKRVFLYDTLVEELEDAEIQAVLAHELGHWQNGHLWKKVCANIAVTALMLAGLWALMQTGWLYDSFGLPQETYVGLLTGAIWLYPVQRLVAPLHNWLSYRHEYEADGFAISLTGDIEANLNALRTLTDENLINPFPHPWYAAFNHAHPPAPERMRHVQDEFEATNQEVQTSGESADTAVANP
jgi:STE24 endopeptidase